MILNTHGGGSDPMTVAVGGGCASSDPKCTPQPLFVCDSPLSAANWAAACPEVAAHQIAPALYQTRRSPAGPKHQHRQDQSAAGEVSIYGLRMLMNGETFFHVPIPTSQRA